MKKHKVFFLSIISLLFLTSCDLAAGVNKVGRSAGKIIGKIK